MGQGRDDVAGRMRYATQALARRNVRDPALRPSAPEAAHRPDTLPMLIAVVVLVGTVAGALALRLHDPVDDERPALAADTSRMVRVDGSHARGGQLYLTVVRKPRSAALVARSRVAMETSKRNAMRSALRCVDPARRQGVSVDAGRVSGGSAGLMLALTVVDALHPLDLHERVAGTGTIAADGAVGPIADIELKAQAAKESGADLFLAPRSQSKFAMRAARGLRVVGVDTLDDAVRALGRSGGCYGTERKGDR